VLRSRPASGDPARTGPDRTCARPKPQQKISPVTAAPSGPPDKWLDALAEDSLGREVPHCDGTVATRDVLVHVIEEYARHTGHADLQRECIDGRTGQ